MARWWDSIDVTSERGGRSRRSDRPEDTLDAAPAGWETTDRQGLWGAPVGEAEPLVGGYCTIVNTLPRAFSTPSARLISRGPLPVPGADSTTTLWVFVQDFTAAVAPGRLKYT